MIAVVAMIVLAVIEAATLAAFVENVRSSRRERAVLINRILARSVEQAVALDNPDVFLASNQPKPVDYLWDQTGLIAVEREDDEES